MINRVNLAVIFPHAETDVDEAPGESLHLVAVEELYYGIGGRFAE